MGKVLYSATMSLDGYIAGPGGDMSWLTPFLGPNPAVDELVGQIGSLLVGARTFRGDDPHKGTTKEGKPFGGGWDGPQFVLTHHVPDTPVPGVTFVGDLAGGVAAAKAAAGDKYVNVLGADVARQCLEAGLLDEIFVLIAPVLLGTGTPLLHPPHPHPHPPHPRPAHPGPRPHHPPLPTPSAVTRTPPSRGLAAPSPISPTT